MTKNEFVISKKPARSGRVAIFGRPNTGKSSLLNSILGQKVSITSHMPQTTRKNKEVVFNSDQGQIIFIDTPGVIGKVNDLVGKKINQEAPKNVFIADVIVCLFDISRPRNDEDNKVIGLIRKAACPKILVYNKIDIAVGPKDHLAEYNYLEEEFNDTIKISAIKGTNIKGLINKIFSFLPEQKSSNFPETKSSFVIAESSSEFIAEIIREKAYLFLRRELPYSIHVQVDSIVDKKKLILVKASIYTTAERYKKMIIGQNGQKIKEIGFNARKELELMSGRHIFLELLVKTDAHWPERVFKGSE